MLRTDVLGIGFDNVTQDEAVDRAMALIAAGGSHYVVTPNAEFVQMARGRFPVPGSAQPGGPGAARRNRRGLVRPKS